jgi:hypothetical protein
MSIRSAISRMIREDAGGITIFALFMFMSCIILGGLAVDVARVQTAMTRLQNAADAAAHAAVYSRPRMSEAEARAVAVEVAARNLPAEWQGAVITGEDIVFGDWEPTSGSFVARDGATKAVRVTGRLIQSRGNRLEMTLLRFAGVPSWDIEQTSIMRVADHDCLQEGLVSETSVEFADSNQFGSGFCVHSNGNLKVGLNNVFQNGVTVSMPAPEGIWMPAQGFAMNSGLQAALRPDHHKLRLLTRLGDIISGLTTAGSEFIPDYITNHAVIMHVSRTVRTTSVTPGRIHWVNCTPLQNMTIASGARLNNVVIVTNCRVDINIDAILENVVLATTHTGTTSINAPNGVQVGKNDNCAIGGGAQLITLGGMRFTNGLKVYGGQLAAAKGIGFTAAPGGVEGASMIAGGEIAGTSGMTFAACHGAGMEDNYSFPSTQLVN